MQTTHSSGSEDRPWHAAPQPCSAGALPCASTAVPCSSALQPNCCAHRLWRPAAGYLRLWSGGTASDPWTTVSDSSETLSQLRSHWNTNQQARNQGPGAAAHGGLVGLPLLHNAAPAWDARSSSSSLRSPAHRPAPAPSRAAGHPADHGAHAVGPAHRRRHFVPRGAVRLVPQPLHQRCVWSVGCLPPSGARNCVSAVPLCVCPAVHFPSRFRTLAAACCLMQG